MRKTCALIIFIFAAISLTTCAINSYIIAELQNGAYPIAGYTGCTDTNMASGASVAGNNYGSCDQGTFGYIDATAGITRYLIRFDVSSIPSGVKVKKAFLTLYAFQGGGSGTVSCHEKTAGWSAGSNCGASGGISWTSSSGGGPFGSSSASDAISVTGLSQKYISFAITESVVQGWIDDSTANHGLILSGDNESTQGYTWSYFADYAEFQYRPKLTIYYTIE